MFSSWWEGSLRLSWRQPWPFRPSYRHRIGTWALKESVVAKMKEEREEKFVLCCELWNVKCENVCNKLIEEWDERVYIWLWIYCWQTNLKDGLWLSMLRVDPTHTLYTLFSLTWHSIYSPSLFSNPFILKKNKELN